MTSTDLTHADYPATRIQDRHFHVDSRPNTTAATWYLNMTADPTIAANTVVLAGHNAGSVSGGWNCVLQTADDDAFSVRLQTIQSFAIPSAARYCIMHTTQYFGLTRLRLEVTAGGGGVFTPQLCEFMYGPRIVLEHNPREPWDSLRRRSDVTIFRSKSGTVKIYSRSNGQRVGSLAYWSNTSDDLTSLRNYFSGTNYGGKPFVYWDDPASPHVANYAFAEPELDLPLVRGQHLRETVINFEEISPYVVSGT